MNRQEILESRDALKRFCRDFNVPVATLDSFYFEKQLNTLSMYSPHYLDLFEEYVQELSKFPSIESYFEYYNNLKENVISYILNNEQFKNFSNSDITCPKHYLKQDIYKPSNDGADFISIDLRKANFTILERYCPDLFYGKTWEEFLASFGASSYLIKSKYLRQVIFGACNPKKQIQAETKLMVEIACKLELQDYKIYSITTDEILISVDPTDPANVVDLIKFVNSELSYISDKLKIEYFTLRKNLQGYEKSIIAGTDVKNQTSVLKCVDSDVYCQVIKYYYHEHVEESDLVFDYKGSLAKFMNPITNPFQNDYLGG